MPTYIMLCTLTPEGVQTVKNNPAADPRGQQRGRAARRDRQGAVGDARALRLHQHRRGARREDDGARLARARLARHRALRVALRDPDRRLHRGLCEGPRRRRRRARARDRPRAAALPAARRSCSARPATRASPRRAAARRARGRSRRARGRGARRRRRPRRRRARRRRSSPGSPTRCDAAGVPLLRPGRRRRAARGLEGVREGGHGGGRRPDRGVRGRARRRGGHGRDHRLPGRDQGRRARGGQGRRDRRRRGGGARRAARRCWSSAGSATCPVVVEEFLDGDELSLLALCDGERALPLAPARDYKRIGDGDTGPNTGGMGCFSPVAGDRRRVRATTRSASRPPAGRRRARAPRHAVPRRALRGADARPPTGPKVLEFNVRFGDPETQVVLPRLALRPARAAARARREPGGLAGAQLDWDPRAAVRVVLATPRLPGELLVRRRHQRTGRAPARRRGRPTPGPPSATATS